MSYLWIINHIINILLILSLNNIFGGSEKWWAKMAFINFNRNWVWTQIYWELISFPDPTLELSSIANTVLVDLVELFPTYYTPNLYNLIEISMGTELNHTSLQLLMVLIRALSLNRENSICWPQSWHMLGWCPWPILPQST